MKIYIVEDDQSIRELVCYTLKSGGFDVHSFESGAEFRMQMRSGDAPDLILLDIMLPGEDGLGILNGLRKNPLTSHIPVIMLTAKASEIDRVTGLDLGADDYIIKPFSVLELISRIKAVLRRTTVQVDADSILTCQGIELDIPKHVLKINNEPVSLTLKEFELLKYLMKNNDIVLSRDNLIENVWDFDSSGESRTVDIHINTLRKKLGEYGVLIKTVRGMGYKLGE